MITLIFKYLGPNDETVSRQLNAPPTTSIKDIRSQITKTIEYLQNRDILLIHYNQILEDDCTIEQISQQGDLIILCFPKVINANIFYGKETPKRIDIDITLPITKAIEKFFKNHKLRKKANLISNYVLAYEKKIYPQINEKELKKKKSKQKKKKSFTKYRVLCSDLPLFAHKWWYSNFYLIRRFTIDDCAISNEEERRFLIDQSQLSAMYGLSTYKMEDWAELISYQYYFQMNDKNPTKEKIEAISPPSIDCSLKLIQSKLKEIPNTLIDAQNSYIKKSIIKGCQCAYFENIKMKWMRFWSKYKIYVSSMNVMIFSGNGKNFQNLKKIASIDHIELKGINVYSQFDKNVDQIDNKLNNLEITNENQISMNEIQSSQNNDSLNNSNDDSSHFINRRNSENNINNSLTNISENNNTLRITIYFKDNTSWEMIGDSQASVSRLKVALDQMVALNLYNNKNINNEEENITQTNLSLNNQDGNNEIDESLNKILGEELGIYNPDETSHDSSRNNSFVLDSQKRIIPYPHYSVIITPEEIDNKIVFKEYNGFNQGNDFDYLKENIQSIKILKNDEKDDNNLPINNSDPLITNFFEFGPSEKGTRNKFLIIISVFMFLYFIRRHISK